jgi:hypothetical protein
MISRRKVKFTVIAPASMQAVHRESERAEF